MVYIEKTYTDSGVSGECRFDGWGAYSNYTVDATCEEQTVCRCRGNSLQSVACSLSCVRLQCDFRGGQTLFDVAWEFPVACLLTVCLCGCGVESGDRSLSLGAPSTSTHSPATYLSSVFGRI